MGEPDHQNEHDPFPDHPDGPISPCPFCSDYRGRPDSYGMAVHTYSKHPEQFTQVTLEYDASTRCPECGHYPAVNGPFAGGVLHSGGCSMPELVATNSCRCETCGGSGFDPPFSDEFGVSRLCPECSADGEDNCRSGDSSELSPTSDNPLDTGEADAKDRFGTAP